MKLRNGLQSSSWKWLGSGGLLLLAGVMVWRFFSPPPQPGTSERTFGTLRVANQELRVVVSQTSAEITQGLSDRDEIGADGMLFVFTRPTQPTFWMYHMKFDLDFIWLNETQVVDLHESVPAPANVGESDAGKIATVRPSESVTAVIEVPAGFIQERGIKRGDAWENVGSQSRGRW